MVASWPHSVIWFFLCEILCCSKIFTRFPLCGRLVITTYAQLRIAMYLFLARFFPANRNRLRRCLAGGDRNAEREWTVPAGSHHQYAATTPKTVAFDQWRRGQFGQAHGTPGRRHPGERAAGLGWPRSPPQLWAKHERRHGCPAKTAGALSIRRFDFLNLPLLGLKCFFFLGLNAH